MKTTLKAVNLFLLSSVLFLFPVSAASSVQIDERIFSAEKPGLKYECRFPHLDGISNQKAEQRLNVELKESAQQFEQAACAAARGLQGSAQTVQGKYLYDVKRNSDGLLSLSQSEELCVSGKRGLVARTGFTVDTVTGRKLSLYDFFTEKADYRTVLSEQVKTEIARRNLRQLEPFRQIKWDEEFYVTDKALVLMFRQYEYFPYECGIQEFSIPFKSLEGVLKPDYSTFKTE